MNTTVVIGYDPMGEHLLQAVVDALTAAGHPYEVTPGSGVENYPDVAWQTAVKVADGGYHSGVLMCGTGLGMSITANKVPGIRAARCGDTYSVEKARRNSAANVLTLGAELTPPALAATLMRTWLAHDFDSARSVPKIKRIDELAGFAGARR
ncbi:RpiB/LacA/LacB family sugar-phosphate isomerase [Actinoplanes sp. NBRC 101535]|uniref:RpiB/LacA/LacB family sugar-phosphate isomerase n=1 Tax=Actinoplanes sp. NBRC 101535 TaxID=3032196 RepID=UPI0024A335D3|nr:RpiB/LacA/LacB family sugar-phosphate isomerase [Actinoplanes sp. NBRC 101535]GLY04037.1 ribose-5-phosphate isomerase [Actinoplanes sp. NBRC 101535]